MRKLQSTLAQLSEKNFDILNNNGMSMLKGGYCAPNPCGNNKSKKSKKSRKSNKCGVKVKSIKSIKNRPNCYNPCGW